MPSAMRTRGARRMPCRAGFVAGSAVPGAGGRRTPEGRPPNYAYLSCTSKCMQNKMIEGEANRKFVAGVLFIPPLIAIIWMAVFGGSALKLDLKSG